MSGGYKISPLLHRPLQKSAKFDITIAHNIWIGCATCRIFTNHVVDNILLVFFDQIQSHKRYIEVSSNSHRIPSFFFPIAFYPIWLPNLDENTSYVKTSIFEKTCRNGTIDTAR
jgi:hypothetical protein